MYGTIHQDIFLKYNLSLRSGLRVIFTCFYPARFRLLIVMFHKGTPLEFLQGHL